VLKLREQNIETIKVGDVVIVNDTFCNEIKMVLCIGEMQKKNEDSDEQAIFFLDLITKEVVQVDDDGDIPCVLYVKYIEPNRFDFLFDMHAQIALEYIQKQWRNS